MSEETTSITPTRPYMVRALYQWIEDNALTPYLMVDATADNVQVPKEHIQDGRIVLNIASRATGNMSMENDYIHFSARFGGVSQEIWVPLTAVMGIYAKENSQGMFFDPNEYDDYVPEEDAATTSKKSTAAPKPKRDNKAGLKVLK
ncbi:MULTISPECIES: ClpXP protease specificity-enhancing factor [Psychrobacter]|jgi:stringent starvation protein B|uniref:ClpXP protease specificity-enhancing factor n=1 Tax=Psychrobacter faecalis TaxID=180588 RepID=A0ABT9HEE4_9GAMM|nr:MULTISPECIES: ClpXP protease specificity-enhancing factor [Psychrobacter]MCG3861353.1 ClpXP protease specificity-enhancing factor [Psychrobacter sp. Ps5]MDP4544146.1 ClpXP protease specificity-enhancing factor [Psychrobacter faecalis]OAP71672.1 ClpXP protease specificity-enhancing factor [Psychrobacter sp. SHUES1]PKG86985.1 ClpXP protease specificity-enhancing factor [Psychrobacter sp. Sarcosine-02u-2]WLW65520.1 ClpXP protease specificity-enhancing factor [Psychrobacter sp. van23A]